MAVSFGGGERGCVRGRHPNLLSCTAYIHVTQSFSILAALCGLVSVLLMVLSCIPSVSIPDRGPLASSVTAFVAGRLQAVPGDWGLVSSHRGAEQSLLSSSSAIFVMVAMVVYTSERWNQPQHPQIQSSFSWSFYLGWVSMILLLCAGNCCSRNWRGRLGGL